MADEILNIAEGTLQDVAPVPIDDVASEAMVKVYPYRMVFSDHDDILVMPQTIAMVSITNKEYTDLEGNKHVPFKNLSKDTGGNPFFMVLPAIRNNAVTEISTTTASIGLELANEQSILALTNDKYHPANLIKDPVETRKGWVDVFTIGEPYNKAKYESDKQAVYVMTDLISATESSLLTDLQMADIVGDDEQATEITLNNIKGIENQVPSFRIRFYEGVLPLQPMVTNEGGASVPGLSITLPVTTPIHAIRGRAESHTDVDVDFFTSDKLVPIKMTPISTNEKLTMYADWFDYDMASPLFMCEKFLTPIPILDAFKNAGAVVQDGEKLTNLIIDIATLSYGYMSEFEGLPRWTSADAANKLTTDAQIGKLKDTTLVTSQRIPVRSLSEAAPAKRITMMIDTFVRKNPGIDTTEQWKEAKGIIAMLSKYAECDYAIGKGANEFNQAYLPWYLDAQDGFVLKEITTGTHYWSLDPTTKFSLRSKWFDVTGSTIDSKPAEDLSEVRLLVTDNRKISLPEMAPNITEISKAVNPGDINLNSPSELSYFYWLPIKDRAEWEKIYLKDRTVQTNNATQNRTFNTEWSPFGQSDSFSDDFIKQQAAKLMGLANPNDVQIVSHGHSESRKKWYLFKEYVGATTAAEMAAALNRSATWRALPNSNADKFISLAQIKTIVKEAFNIDWDAVTGYMSYGGFKEPISDLGGAGMQYMKNRSGWWDSLGFIGLELQSKRHLNVQVTVAGATVTTYNFETRPILFDRVEWNRFMKEHNFFKELEHTYRLYSKYGTPIKKLKELSISSIFGTYIKLDINGVELKWDTFNSDDESIGIERVLFA